MLTLENEFIHHKINKKLIIEFVWFTEWKKVKLKMLKD